ncbi:MAG: NAD-dependent epimerase/dehydratase family protein [Chloroflexi bacterium]|nr:NAD-dependent epimerase/dehydratase family protein [Chloroflexota bacterium]
MKILVTGGAGFIGSHLVDRLEKDSDHQISIFDNLFRGKRENISRHLNSGRIEFLEKDLRDYSSLLNAARGSDVIYHLGAQSNVMGAVTDVDYSFNTNVGGTFNVLKAAQEAHVGRVVFTSSREVYGDPQFVPVSEDHPLGSKNTYGASKAAGELYCRVFQNLFDVQTSVLRLANVYGSRDFGRVIPLWLGWAREGRDLTVYGGRQVIDFIWIDVVVEALIRASKVDLHGQPVNIGSGKGTPILELAQRIIDLAGTGSKVDMHPARGAEVVEYIAKVDRMMEVLDLNPPHDPLSGLEILFLKSKDH